MSTQTTNLNLEKPGTDEFYDVNVQNRNMDKIDTKVKSLESSIGGIVVPVTSVNTKTGSVVLSAGDIKAADGATVESHLAEKANKFNGIINTLTTSLVGGNYYVANGDATFPYAYGLLYVMDSGGEKTAIYQTTGSDKKTYSNVLTVGQPWTGWKKLLDTNDTKVIQDIYNCNLNGAVESSIVRSHFVNYPVGLVPDGQGICEIYSYCSGWVKQVFISPHVNFICERVMINGVWQNWHINFNSSNYGAVGYNGGNVTISADWSNDVVYGGGIITIPANVFLEATQITFINLNGGVFSFVPASGVEIRSNNKRIIDGADASATLIHLNNNIWSLIGALK